MPQFWIAIFFILLAIAELYQSMKDIELPLPVYLVLGTLLAAASSSQTKLLFQDRNKTLLQSQKSDLAINSVHPNVLVAMKNTERV